MDAFDKVGKTSFGDCELDENSQRLFIVNTFQNSIIDYDVSAGTTDILNYSTAQLGSKIKHYPLSGIPGIPSCTGGTLRPFAMKIYRVKGYLGCTCDASSSQNESDLTGYILQFDINNAGGGFTNVLTLSNFTYRNSDAQVKWYPWVSNWAQTGLPTSGALYFYNQPLINDIEFDERGGMIINILTRWGHQVGHQNMVASSGVSDGMEGGAYGDILYACYNESSDNWTIEGSGSCAINHTSDVSGLKHKTISYSGLGSYFDDRSGDLRPENGMGGLVNLKGSQRVVNPVVDPFPESAGYSNDWIYTGGLHWYRTLETAGSPNGG